MPLTGALKNMMNPFIATLLGLLAAALGMLAIAFAASVPFMFMAGDVTVSIICVCAAIACGYLCYAQLRYLEKNI